MELESVASSGGGTLDSVTVTFSESTSRRRRRSSNTDAVITAVYSFEVPASSDISSLTSAVSSSTSTAANSAISNSAGTYMSTSAVTSVSSSAQVVDAVQQPCPTTECWQYDAPNKQCILTEACVKLNCGATTITMSVLEGVFGAADSATVTGSTKDSDNFYNVNCNLGDVCENHSFNSDGTK